MRVPESEGVKVAPVNPGAYQEYAAPSPDGREAKAWGEAANSAGGFGVSMLVSERAKAIKQADDLQFNMMVNEAEKANRRLTFDEKDGYLSALGANALPDKDGVSLQDKMHEARKRSIDQILSGASNERVRRRFQKWDLENSSKFDAAVSKHVFEQYIKVQGDTFADRAQGATSDAITLASQGDLVGALAAVDGLKTITDEVAAMSGNKADYQKMVGPGLAAVIEAAKSRGEDAAVLKDIFRNNEDLFDPKLRATVRDELKSYGKEQKTDVLAEGIVKKYGRNHAGALAEALKGAGLEDEDDKATLYTKVYRRVSQETQAQNMAYQQEHDKLLLKQAKNPEWIPSAADAARCSPQVQAAYASQRHAKTVEARAKSDGRIGAGDTVVMIGADASGKGGTPMVITKEGKALAESALKRWMVDKPDEFQNADLSTATVPPGYGLPPYPLAAVLSPTEFANLRWNQTHMSDKGGANIKALAAEAKASFSSTNEDERERFVNQVVAMALEMQKGQQDNNRDLSKKYQQPMFATAEGRKQLIEMAKMQVDTGSKWSPLSGKSLWRVLEDQKKAAADGGKGVGTPFTRYTNSSMEKVREIAVSNISDVCDSGRRNPKTSDGLVARWFDAKVSSAPAGKKMAAAVKLTDGQAQWMATRSNPLGPPQEIQDKYARRLIQRHKEQYPSDKAPYTPTSQEVMDIWAEDIFKIPGEKAEAKK